MDNYAFNNNPRDRLHDQVVNQDTFPKQSRPLDPNFAGDQRQTSSTDNAFQQDQDFRRQNAGSDLRSGNLQQPYRESQPQDAVWGNGNERGQGQVATDRDLGGSRLGQGIDDNTGYPKNFGQTDFTNQQQQQQQPFSDTGNLTQEQQRALFRDNDMSQGQRTYNDKTSSGLPHDLSDLQQTPEQRQALANEYGIHIPNSTGTGIGSSSGFQQGQTSFEQQQPYSSQQQQQQPYSSQQQQQQPYSSQQQQQQPYSSPQQPYSSPQQPYSSPQQPYSSPQQPYSSQQQPYSSQQGQTTFEQQQRPYTSEQGQQQPYQDVNTRSSMPGAFDLDSATGSRDQYRAQPGQDTTFSEPISATMPSDRSYDQRQSNLPTTGTFDDGARNSSGLMDRYQEAGRFGDNRDVDRATQAGGLGSGVLQDRNLAQEGFNARSGVNSGWNNDVESGPRVSADEGVGLTSPPPLPPRNNDFNETTPAPAAGGYQDIAQEVDRQHDQRNQQLNPVDDGLSSGISNLTLRSNDPNRQASPLNQDALSDYPEGVSKLSGNDTTDTSGLTSQNRFEDTSDNTYRNAPLLSDRTGAVEEVNDNLKSSAPQPGYTSTDNTQNLDNAQTGTQNFNTDNTQTGTQNLGTDYAQTGTHTTDTHLEEEKPSYTEGLGKKLKGTFKYGLGKILGDQYLQAEGEQQKREGQQTLEEHRKFVDQKGHDTEQTAATDPAARREE